jgi:hypothetical protein
VKRRGFLLGALLAPLVAAARSLPAAQPRDALAYYRWAEGEGARLYALQRRAHQAQLVAITDGMGVESFIAARQAESVRLLAQLHEAVQRWRAA